MAWATVRRAKGRLGAKAERQSEEGTKRGRGQWVWSLQGAPVQGAHSRCSFDVRDFEHLEEYEQDQGTGPLQDAQTVQDAHTSKVSTLKDEAVDDAKAQPVCDQLNGEGLPRVCGHCGAPETAAAPVQLCAVDGETFLLHRGCQAEWLGVTIPHFLRRTSIGAP